MEKLFEQVINVDRMEQTVSLFGSFDENIKLIESQYNVKVISRGSEIKVSGDAENVSKAVRAISGLLMLINRGEILNEQNVRYVISLVGDGNEDKLSTMSNDCICITSKGKPVKPKTLGQKKYVETIKKNIQYTLTEEALGQISEIFDGDAPHTSRGCYAQAWSIAEILRAITE